MSPLSGVVGASGTEAKIGGDVGLFVEMSQDSVVVIDDASESTCGHR